MDNGGDNGTVGVSDAYSSENATLVCLRCHFAGCQAEDVNATESSDKMNSEAKLPRRRTRRSRESLW
eukprot:895593-Ditylum_brightwellii.AAC.1